jgi:hypothetical protein
MRCDRSDYEVRTCVNQSILEQKGIELLVDEYGGYLYYCPMRGVYSSNGVFDHFQPSTMNANTPPPAHSWNSGQSSKIAHLPSKEELNVWNSFKLTSSLAKTSASPSKSHHRQENQGMSTALNTYRSAYLQQQQQYKRSQEEDPALHLLLLDEAFAVARNDLLASSSTSMQASAQKMAGDAMMNSMRWLDASEQVCHLLLYSTCLPNQPDDGAVCDVT